MIYQNISQNITKYMKIAYNLKRPWKVEFCSCHSEKYFARLILGSRSPSLTHIVEFMLRVPHDIQWSIIIFPIKAATN